MKMIRNGRVSTSLVNSFLLLGLKIGAHRRIIDTWSALPRKESLPLLNQTERLMGDMAKYGEPRYAVGLEIFHQLHCLVWLSTRRTAVQMLIFHDRTW